MKALEKAYRFESASNDGAFCVIEDLVNGYNTAVDNARNYGEKSEEDGDYFDLLAIEYESKSMVWFAALTQLAEHADGNLKLYAQHALVMITEE